MEGKGITYTPAEIVSAAENGIVVSTNGVYDKNKEKFLDLINIDFENDKNDILLRISELTPEDIGALPSNTNYAGSDQPGGAATSADKINTDAGTSKKPVYFKNGIPVEIDHSIGKNVPSNAEFTDTVTNISYLDKKIKQSINGNLEDIVSSSDIVTDGGGLKEHQLVIDSNPTLSWGLESKIGLIGNTDIHVTMPNNPNTDTSVTSENNHYTPVSDENSKLLVSASGASEEWNIDVVKGISIFRDSKGHITNILVISGKTPLRPIYDFSEITGKVDSSQLPGYVDDVIELSSMSSSAPLECLTGDLYYNIDSRKIFEAISTNTWDSTGTIPEKGKIYTNLTNNKTYRWGGTDMVVISDTLALGETSSTAFRGDLGKIAYDHATDQEKVNESIAEGLYKITVTSEGHIKSVSSVTKLDIVNLGIPGQDTLNTSGATDTNDKIFIIGAKALENNPQTYSHDTVYIGIDGCLYSGGLKVITDISSKSDKETTVTNVIYLNKKFIKTINLENSDITDISTIKSDLLLTKSDVGLSNVGNFKAVSTESGQELSNEEKSNARTNIGAGTSSLVLGNNAENAFYGDKGKIAYDHATDFNKLTTAKSEKLYKISTTAEGHIKSVTEVLKSDIIGLGIPGEDTHYTANPIVGNSSDVSNSSSDVLNPYVNIVENNTKSGGILFSGDGATVVKGKNGIVTISSTDLSVDSVSHHYTPTKSTTKSASGGSLVDITNSELGTLVITGIEMDASGHVTGVVSKALKSVNTTYSLGEGISISGNTINNSGVRSISIGTSNGTISVNTGGTSTDVSVKGLDTAAYKKVADFFALDGSYTNIPSTELNPANLNTYTTTGNYSCTNNNTSATVLNQPITAGSAFRLIVLKSLSSELNYIRHIYLSYDNSEDIWTRTSTNGGSSWNNWRCLGNLYTSGSGIDLTNGVFSNSGVRSISTGSVNGTISVNTNGTSENISVYGLGSAAYKDIKDTYSSTDTNAISGKGVAAALATLNDSDTLNTAGSTNTNDKIFLIGAKSLTSSSQTYSHDTAYVGTDGCLYSGGVKVLTSHLDISGKANKSETVSTVSYDTTNKKITKTINGSKSDVVTASTIVTDGGGIKSHQTVTDNNPTLSWGSKSKVATIGSTAINVTMPAKPSYNFSDIGGMVSLNQLPSYVDDVIEGYFNTDGQFYDRLAVQIGNLYWATMNVGANSITDTGLYFQWGDTQGYTADQVGSGTGQKYFGWADYKYGNGTSSPGATGMTKYNSTDGKTVLDLSDDAVRANWGGSWRMPTTAEFQALGNAVNTEWTADYQGSGVSGLVMTDKTNSSKVLFFPAAGICLSGNVNYVGRDGRYWSSSALSSYVQYAYTLNFSSSSVNWQYDYSRYLGYTVRGVSSTAPTIIPEAGKIYVDKVTNKTYRWSGSNYIEISKSLALGETSSTAYRGDRGKLAYDHISNTNNPHNVTKSQIGLNNVVNTGDSNTPVSGGTTKFTTGGAYTELNKKVDKVSGKGLSTNDYTTDEKNKLAGIAAGAEVNVQSDWNATSGDAFIKNKPTIPSEVTESTVNGWGFTKNTGTITGIKMNGSSKGTSGVVDLGTVITAHQDISGKVDKTTTVNGHALSGNVSVTKSDVGLGNVGNFKAVSTVASQGLSDTEKANARANIGAGTSSLTLGTGASNAYYGDKGKTAYDHASDANRLTTSKESGLYKIAVTNLGHVLSVTAVAKSDITSLGIPALDNSVKQEYVTGYTDWRSIILGLSHGSDEQYTPETITGLTYIVKDLSYKPDSGILRTKQFKSTVSTGTAPFIISSTTKVDNLNADTVDGYHEDSFFRYRGAIDVNYVDLTTYTAKATNYQNPKNGIWNISRQGYSEGLITFTGSCSASGLDIYFHYEKGGIFKFRRRIDSNRLSGDWETFITSENIGSQSVDYATSAGSVTWTNVSSKPETATRWPSWSEVTGKPSTFTPSEHTHNFLVAYKNESNVGALSSFTKGSDFIYGYAGGGNPCTDKPSDVDAFGLMSFKTAAGWYGQILVSSNSSTGIYWRTATSLSGGWKKILDSDNSSVSLSGSTLTVKINGTEKSLTNTWRGIQNNLTSDSTTDSLSAAQGKALNSKFSNYVLKSGDTMTGTLINTTSPGFANEVAASSWAYIRFKSGTTSEWHVGTNSSTAGILGQANAFEIRDAKSSYTGIAVRCNTSSYGKLVVTAASGETSIGLRSGTSGNPQWVFGIIDSSNYRFGFYNGGAWKANFSQNGYLYLGDGNTAASERLHVSGNTRITGDIRIEGNDEYLGTGTGSQCHLLYDNTNKCLNFIFD